MTEDFDEVRHLNITHENKRQNSRFLPWIAAFVILLTFFVLDAGAVAWSASLIGGRQLMAELFTFLVVVSGAVITVWKLKAR
jgi:hypothetical protein